MTTAWRERPRVAVAFVAGLVEIVVVAGLVGAALAGNGDCPTGDGAPPRTQR